MVKSKCHATDWVGHHVDFTYTASKELDDMMDDQYNVRYFLQHCPMHGSPSWPELLIT